MEIPLVLPRPPFPARARLIVGVSGGSDSSALLGLLADRIPRFRERLVAAHVNYGLRGRESEGDEEWVHRLCRQWGIPLRRLRVRERGGRSALQGGSLQDRARWIRYSFFQKLAAKEGAWGAAVAHHRGDQAETVLDRFLRGAGSRGLSGLRPVQALEMDPRLPALRVWRPLLAYTKSRLEDYLSSRGLSWREDRSNGKIRYRRNQIRHEVLPFLSRWNPNLGETLARLGEITAAEDELLEELLGPAGRSLKGRWERRTYSCDAARFQEMPLALKRRWVRRVAERLNPGARGFSFDRIGEVLRLWEGEEKGPRDLGFQLAAWRTQNRAFLGWKGV